MILHLKLFYRKEEEDANAYMGLERIISMGGSKKRRVDRVNIYSSGTYKGKDTKNTILTKQFSSQSDSVDRKLNKK